MICIKTVSTSSKDLERAILLKTEKEIFYSAKINFRPVIIMFSFFLMPPSQINVLRMSKKQASPYHYGIKTFFLYLDMLFEYGFIAEYYKHCTQFNN